MMNFTEYPDDDSERRGTVSQAPAASSSRRLAYPVAEQTMAKFVQICASRDDLFALDEEGSVYQYNFNAKTWVKLVASRSYERRA
jgi:hypothetical protein